MDVRSNEDLAQSRGSFVNRSRHNELKKSSLVRDVMSGPLYWFSFKNHDRTIWTTEWSSHEISPQLRGRAGTRGYDGLTQPEIKLVTLDSASYRTIQDYTTLHEMMHVSLDGVHGVSGKAEENVITQMAPRLYPILQKFGLRWPDRPEDFAALERRARRNSR